jgi:hypothetical protein
MILPPPIWTPGQSRTTSALQYLIASACWMGALDPAHAKAASESVPTIAR